MKNSGRGKKQPKKGIRCDRRVGSVLSGQDWRQGRQSMKGGGQRRENTKAGVVRLRKNSRDEKPESSALLEGRDTIRESLTIPPLAYQKEQKKKRGGRGQMLHGGRLRYLIL